MSKRIPFLFLMCFYPLEIWIIENSYRITSIFASLCRAMKAIEINVRFFKEKMAFYKNTLIQQVCASLNPINNAIRAGFDYKSVVAK